MGVVCLSLFIYALICVHSSFAIILTKKRKLVALLLLLQMYCYLKCSVALHHGALGGLQYLIVVFADHTHLLFLGFLNPFHLTLCILETPKSVHNAAFHLGHHCLLRSSKFSET